VLIAKKMDIQNEKHIKVKKSKINNVKKLSVFNEKEFKWVIICFDVTKTIRYCNLSIF